MILGARRLVLMGAIAAVALTIILLPVLFAQTAPDLDRVQVSLERVDIRSVETQNIELGVVFRLDNPTSNTVTTSKIEYDLYADGESLGLYTLSYEDVPINGRPALFPEGTVTLTSLINVPFEDSYAETFDRVSNNEISEWDVSGTTQIEAALTLHVKTFDTR